MKKGITGGTSNILIRLDTPPHLTVPLSGATGVDSATQFQWTAGAGVYLVSVRPSGSGSPPRFTILTMNTSTYLPNLTAFGLGLPPGTLYHWDVTQFAPVSSVDFAASNDFHPLLYLFGEGGEIGFGESERFSFTTRQ